MQGRRYTKKLIIGFNVTYLFPKSVYVTYLNIFIYTKKLTCDTFYVVRNM